MFLKNTVNIYICQIEPYYSNYNTFHIIAILEVKKSNIPENYVEKPMVGKTTNYYLVFFVTVYRCFQLVLTLLFCFAF